jgi:hypothetical protein
VEEEETILSPGDVMYFDSGAAHTYRQHFTGETSADRWRELGLRPFAECSHKKLA